MDGHKRELGKLCRICGKNIPRGAKRWEKQDRVLSCYTVDIASDSDDIHPPTICNGCYARMSRPSASRGKKHYTPAEGTVTAWSPHTDSCFLCHAKSGAGRPAKSRGQPPGETTNIIIAHIREPVAPSVTMSMDTARICSYVQKVALHTLEGLVTWCTLHLQNAESSTQFSVLLQQTERKRAVISTMVRKMDYTGKQWFMFRSSRLATLPGQCKGNLRRRMVLLCMLWKLLWSALMSHARHTMKGLLLETMYINV